MGAVTDDPGHLARWAAANGISHDGFLSRPAYGRYLRELLADTERMAGPAATRPPRSRGDCSLPAAAARHRWSRLAGRA